MLIAALAASGTLPLSTRFDVENQVNRQFSGQENRVSPHNIFVRLFATQISTTSYRAICGLCLY